MLVEPESVLSEFSKTKGKKLQPTDQAADVIRAPPTPETISPCLNVVCREPFLTSCQYFLQTAAMAAQNASPSVDLASRYREYIACLNSHAWSDLSQHVAEDVSRNGGEQSGIQDYEKMIRDDYERFPGLMFEITTLEVRSAEQKVIARLHITFKLPSGEQSSLMEDVSYTYETGKIKNVQSVVEAAT